MYFERISHRSVIASDISDCQGVFALVCRPAVCHKEKLYSFSLLSEDVTKDDYLKTLCKQISVATCRTDHVSCTDVIVTSDHYDVIMFLSLLPSVLSRHV